MPEDVNNSAKSSILNLAGIEVIQDGKESRFNIGKGSAASDRLEEHAKTILTSEINRIFSRKDNDNFAIKSRYSDDGKSISLLTYDKSTSNSAIGLSKRSLGFRSYLTMYFTMFVYFKQNTNSRHYVVLLDEPDLYLNPSAQKDLINVFKEKFKNCQIIYTTHSPYMIDTEDIKIFRLVYKDSETKVYNNIQDYHKNVSINKNEIDLMTPVVTALGLDIAYRLTNINDSKIILVEGIQDYYILKRMIIILDYQEKMKKFEIIPNMGASKIQYMYSYLLGLGYDLYVIFDDDISGKDELKNIVKSLSGTGLEKN